MNKRIQRKLLTGTLAILAIAGAGVNASANPDLETLFYTYSKDNMVFDYYLPNYIYSSWKRDAYSYDGVLALEQIDLNVDGVEELLVIRLKGVKQEENGYLETENNVVAEVYQYQGDRLQRIAQHTMADRVLCYDINRMDIFLKSGIGSPILCCEKRECASLFSDGQDWQFESVVFDGTQFTEVASAKVEGSGWTEEEEVPAWNALEAVELYPNDIIYTSIADQVGSIEMINSIRRYMITDYDTINSFLNDGTQVSMLYGETCFHSYVNEGMQNKMNENFYYEQVMETAVIQDEDYIIPGSDSRYISEEDLTNLSEYDILLARNEIYARHGYIFNNTELDAYFRSKSWYIPTVTGADFTEKYASQVFNEYEVVNIGTIIQYEQRNGLNQF